MKRLAFCVSTSAIESEMLSCSTVESSCVRCTPISFIVRRVTTGTSSIGSGPRGALLLRGGEQRENEQRKEREAAHGLFGFSVDKVVVDDVVHLGGGFAQQCGLAHLAGLYLHEVDVFQVGGPAVEGAGVAQAEKAELPVVVAFARVVGITPVVGRNDGLPRSVDVRAVQQARAVEGALSFGQPRLIVAVRRVPIGVVVDRAPLRRGCRARRRRPARA